MRGAGGSGPTELISHVEKVRERYELGILDAEDAAAALGRIHLVDTAGHAWSVGVRSRDWYRFRDGRWMAAGRPPDPADLVSGAELLARCPSCGAPGGGSRFCAECGTPQAPMRLGSDAELAIAAFLEGGYDTLPEPLPERAERPETVDPRSAVPPAPPAPLPSSPSAQPAATTESARPRRRSIRSVLSTVIGAGLLVVSGSRLVLGVAGGTFEPPAASPEPTFVGGGLTVASAEPVNSVGPGATVSPTSPPADGSTWFTDGFDAEGAWPTGDDGITGASYEDGWYLLTAHPSDLPAYRWAVNEGTVGASTTVEADIVFESDGPTAVGLAVTDAGAMSKLVVLLEPAGEWMLARDDIESFETLFAGRTDPLEPKTVHRLRLALDGAGSVSAWLDGTELATASTDLVVSLFGVAVWSVEDGGRVAVDDYLVTVP